MSPVRNAGLKETQMAAPPILSALDARTQIFPTLSPARFMKSFDDLLVRRVGAEELSRVLAAVGTNLPQWLAASDVV